MTPKKTDEAFVATNRRVDELIQRLAKLEKRMDEVISEMYDLEKRFKNHASIGDYCPHTMK